MSGIQNLLLSSKPAAAAEDPNFEYVTLLLPGNGTNGAQNNTFLDSSANNFTITRNGNTTQGTFSPFSRSDGNWSNFFASNSPAVNYLTTPSITLSGDFTIEGYVYWDGVGVSPAFFTLGDSSLSSGLEIYRSSGNWILFAQSTRITGSAAVVGQWTYIALTRSGSTVTMYIDGVSQGTWTSSATFSGTVKIGAEFYASTFYSSMSGYISNFRINNTTAISTVPTVPLTAVSGTILLTCQSNRFVDNSASPLTITVNGTPSVQVFNGFEPSAAWSASTNGGSGYFDENGDYLDCGNGGTDYEFGSGDFTIEGWFYCLGKSLRHQMIMAKGSPTTNNAYDWRLYWGDTGNQRIWFDSNVFSVSSDTTAAEGLVLNAWNHIAVVRSGANGYLYLNGTRIDSVAASGTMNNSYTNVYVGAGNVGSAGQTYYNGYANGIRLLKGTAQYTGSTYTVPTSPFTAITNTELLLNFTNAGIYDAAAMNNLETVGNAQISTAQSKFGGSSISFDGTGDYLICNSVTANPLEFGSGNFTIEFWLYLNSTGTQVIFDGRSSSASNVAPLIYYLGGLNYYTAGLDRITGGTLSTGQWYHIALSRSGTSTKLFINGTQTGSTYTDSNSYVQFSGRPLIAAEGVIVGSNPLNGYINDLRVTKGVARYTANFTAPTAAFPLF